MAPAPSGPPTHSRLDALVQRARLRSLRSETRIGIVFPCDPMALDAAARIADSGLARPLLIGPPDAIAAAADQAGVDLRQFEIIATGVNSIDAAQRATALVREGAIGALMKGSLHSDVLLSAVVHRRSGMHTDTRLSHTFVFDLPRYPKLLALTDCVVNIAPHISAKRAILRNAVTMLQKLGIANPKVGILAAVESVNPAMTATIHAEALVAMCRQGEWPGAIVEGPLGFDNAISAHAANIKNIDSEVAGDADLLLVPDLNAGNILYKSFNYIGGGDCAGLVLGARVPIILTSRADSLQSRIASVALAVLTRDHVPE
jgi:phosphate acetyltransferase